MKRACALALLTLIFSPVHGWAVFDKQFICVNYSPWHGGSYGPDYVSNPKAWGDYTQQDITNDLKIVAKNFQTIRTYTVQYNNKYIVPLAAQYNLKVYLGANLWQPVSDPQYKNGHDYAQAKAWAEAKTYPELDEVISEANAYPNTVQCIVVGNEWIGRAEDGFLVAADGIAYMTYVRSKLTGAAQNIPVTTCERWGVLAGPDQAGLRSAVDQFVLANIYPFWDGVAVVNWQAQFESDYNALNNVMPPGKAVAIGETGWPTGVQAVNSPHTDTPGAASQKTYIQAYTQWAVAHQVTSFLFEIFDEPWKWSEGQNAANLDGVGDHWGLYDTGGKAKWLGPALAGPIGNLLLE